MTSGHDTQACPPVRLGGSAFGGRLFQQAKALKDRVEYLLQGEKKIILTRPARRLRGQLEAFSNTIPENAQLLTPVALKAILDGVTSVQTFLDNEANTGELPYHVQLTLSERLQDLARPAKAYLKFSP